MNNAIKTTIAVAVVLVASIAMICLSDSQSDADEESRFSVSGGAIGTDYVIEPIPDIGYQLTVLTSVPLEISTTDDKNGNYVDYRIIIEDEVDAYVTIDGIDLSIPNTNRESSIDLGKGSTLHLTVSGENNISSDINSNASRAPLIHVPEGTELYIDGTGTLNLDGDVSSSTTNDACAIGTTSEENFGYICIEGSTINIRTDGTGIGSGWSNGATTGGGTVEIKGGNVAINESSIGIGSCGKSTVIVSGGNLDIQAKTGIGYGGVDCTISGGTIRVECSIGGLGIGTISASNASTNIEIGDGIIFLEGSMRVGIGSSQTTDSSNLNVDISGGYINIDGRYVGVGTFQSSGTADVTITGGTFEIESNEKIAYYDRTTTTYPESITGGWFNFNLNELNESYNLSPITIKDTQFYPAIDNYEPAPYIPGYDIDISGDSPSVEFKRPTVQIVGETSAYDGVKVYLTAVASHEHPDTAFSYVWYKDSISDENEIGTGDTVAVFSSGSYYVVVTATFDGDTSSCQSEAHTITFETPAEPVKFEVSFGNFPNSEKILVEGNGVSYEITSSDDTLMLENGTYKVTITTYGFVDTVKEFEVHGEDIRVSLSYYNTLAPIELSLSVEGDVIADGSATISADIANYGASHFITYTYLWNDESDGDHITVDSYGTYSVTVTATYNGKSVSAESEIDYLPSTEPMVSLVAEGTLADDGQVTLSADVENVYEEWNADYHWSTGSTEPTITVTSAGEYSLSMDLHIYDQTYEYELSVTVEESGSSLDEPRASIGETTYYTLESAFSAATDGDTITLLRDTTLKNGIVFDKSGSEITFDLNGRTFTVTEGANISNRAIQIVSGTLNVVDGSADKTGKIVAEGSGTTSADGTGAYGTFRVENEGKLVATGISLENSRPYGMNVKVLGGEAVLTEVTITSAYGGGIEVTEAILGTQSKPGTAVLNDCSFTQTGYFDHCSSAISVSGGSSLTVNGGVYKSEGRAIYVFSSGGFITVNDGYFSGDMESIHAAIDLNTYPEYEGGVKVDGGFFVGGFTITSPATLAVTGGYFDHDVGDYVADGYVMEGSSAPYVVGTRTVTVGDDSYVSLYYAMKNADDGDTIVLNADLVERYPIVLDGDRALTLDMNGHTVTYGHGHPDTILDLKSSTVLTITGDGSFTIDDGYFVTNDIGYTIRLGGSSEIIIESGDFYAGMTCIQVGDQSKATIYGGSFSAAVGWDDRMWLLNKIDGSDTEFLVYGGSFLNFDPSESVTENPNESFCAEGYDAFPTENGDDTVWTVIQVVATVGDTPYPSLQSAIDASSGSTVMVVADSDAGASVASGTSVTIDLNGHTTGTISVSGSVTVAGTGTVGGITLADTSATATIGVDVTLGSTPSSGVSGYRVTSSSSEDGVTYSLYRYVPSGGGGSNPPQQPETPDTDIEEHPDGSTTETTTDTTTNTDGSKTETTTVVEKDPEGNVTGSTVTETTTSEKNEGGVHETTSTTTTTTSDGDGNVTGSTTSSTVTTVTDTTTTVTEKEEVSDADGNVTSSTEKVTETTQIDSGTMTTETTTSTDAQGNTSTTESVKAESDDGNVTTTSDVREDGTTVTTVISGSAQIDDAIIDLAVSQSTAVSQQVTAENPDKVIQIGTEDDGAADVTLSPNSMAALADTGAEFKVICGTGSMQLDSDVVSTLTEPQQDVTVRMSESDDSDLTDAQVQAKGDRFGVTMTATVGNERYHLLGGLVTVTIPYSSSMGADPSVLGVFYIDEDGVRTFMQSVFDSVMNAFVFQTDHFSLFVIDEAPAQAPADSGDDNTMLYIGIAVVVIVVIAVAAVAVKRH